MTMENEKIAVEFGNFIREEREKRGLYQTDIARQVGVTRSYYCYIESGSREIYFSLALKICDALKLNMDEFRKRLK